MSHEEQILSVSCYLEPCFDLLGTYIVWIQICTLKNRTSELQRADGSAPPL